MASALLVPPGGELCVFLLGDEVEVDEVEQRVKEVGCQWESPDVEAVEEVVKREVGCQSEAVDRRDVSVQVDLLTQQLADSSAVLLQCVSVRAHGPHGGALLQTTTTALRPIPPQRRTRSGSRPSAIKRSPSSNRVRQKTGLKPRRVEACVDAAKHESSGRRVEAPTRGPSGRRRRVPRWRQQDDGDLTWTSAETGVPPGPPPPPVNGAASPMFVGRASEACVWSSVCDVCGKVLRSKSSLARHSFIHTGQRPFACSLCPLRFNRRDNLQHHLARLHPDGAPKAEKPRSGGRAWLCAVCGKTFSCRSRLRTHEVIHSGVKPHRCDLCPKAYMRVNDLQHHQKTVHVNGAAQVAPRSSLLCDLCGREFKSRSQLSVHYQTHTGERPHRCHACGRKFARAYQLKRHQILIHSGGCAAAEQSERCDTALTCAVCGKRLKSEAHLASHAHIHSGDKPHRCSVCLRGFHRRVSLQQHHAHMHQTPGGSAAPATRGNAATNMRGANAAAPKLYPCLSCGKVFKFKSLLASHSAVHSDLRPHACDLCSRRFRRLSHLKRHRDVVHDNGAKPPQSFVCRICGKDKKCRSQLERHAIVHTGERPYGCELCPARFNRHGNLKQHRRRMHGVGDMPPEEAPPIFTDEEDDLTSNQEQTLIAINESEPQVREEEVVS